ncbi:Alanine--tRNA ligase [Zea mays]|uniref:alanine--tRNA ligase n=1 Tax=Zea mays TaxID=4577 RepID=A0A1D6KHG6_MAIZE|nr:Alanine--tRNA ligase [Zea mays]
MATLSWWMEWSVENVREAFFSYFGENQHVRLPSPSDVLFKATFSLPIDGSFFNMQKYKLPQSRIYASYFSGDMSSCLSSVDESRNTLQKYIGAEKSCLPCPRLIFGCPVKLVLVGHVLVFFLDCSDNNDGVDSVRNITDGKLVDICRLVFVEFDRQADGVLEPFQAKHVLTGINLECLAAILQKKESHYDLDVYAYVIRQVYWVSFKDYTGKVGAADTDGVDTAYRLVADHMRMIAVTNAPGSQLGLGNEGREYFLKCADKQAVKYGYQVLKINEEDYDIYHFYLLLCASLLKVKITFKMKPAQDIDSMTGLVLASLSCNFYSDVVDAILLNEPDLCTELEKEIIDRIVKDEVMIYKKTKAELRNQEQPFDMGKKKKRNKNVPAVVWYPTRVIEFLGRRTPIILKEKDTRCSLVAICFTLTSWSLLEMPRTEFIHFLFLCHCRQRSPAWRENNPRFRYQESVGEPSHPSCPEASFVWQYTNAGMQLYICKCFENECPLTQKLSYCPLILQLEQNLELSEFNKQVLGVLPKLTCSLYFDVTFSSSCGLEKTFETALFGFLGVPLRHGWMLSWTPRYVEAPTPNFRIILLSMNQFDPKTNSGPQKHGRYEDDMFYTALAFSKTGSEKELDSTSCATISTFLQGPQLTRYGFSSLHNDLRALQPTVLIWNENLITISKFEDKIYVLLNDLSLLRTETDAVWERLTQANGDGVFVDCNFVPTDSKIQSVLPLTKTERKKRIKEKMDLKKKEKDSNKDKDDEDTKDKDDGKEEDSNEDRDDEETEEKDDGNVAPQTYFLQGRHINLNAMFYSQGDISFEPHETVVSMEYLLGLVLALLGGSVKMQDYSDERKSQILNVVKSLAGGFDMDVIFTRTDGFTMTPEWLLLDCLDLNLRHGWIAARDLLTGPEVSFESLTLASNEPGFPHAEEIKNFLRGPQLTPIGLVSLQEDFVENVPCILFWNKHYHTIVMINGVLNSLVTDSNYLETRVVWQTLDGVCYSVFFIISLCDCELMVILSFGLSVAWPRSAGLSSCSLISFNIFFIAQLLCRRVCFEA